MGPHCNILEMLLKPNCTKLNGSPLSFRFRVSRPRFFSDQREGFQLVKKVSSNRSQWERLRSENSEDATHHYNPQMQRNLAHSGFGKSLSTKSRLGFKFMGKLQMVTKSTSDEHLTAILAELSKYIDEFTPYELVDMGYFLARINRPICSQVVEPILHRFFSLPERSSCLNGVYFHRLLRTMFIFQDVTYRMWVYEIAKLVSDKHEHLLMRDVQLIVDDLSLFYDAAAQGALNLLEEALVRRVSELEMYRLPLLIHALGRCGYNSKNVAKVVHNVYLKYRGHQDYYSSHLVGLLLRGYVSFQFNPGSAFLRDLWENMEGRVQKTEFKYLSWIAESFVKLRFFEKVPRLLDELLGKYKILSHLEFTDFISSCWAMQTHLLSLEFRPYLVADSIWQDRDHGGAGAEPGSLSEERNGEATLEMVKAYYDRLFAVLMSEIPDMIYDSTPPYRATQFELLTRLVQLYPNPRDFGIDPELRKYEPIYPRLSFPNEPQAARPGELGYIFRQMDYLGASNLFGRGDATGSASRAPALGYEAMVLDSRQEPLRSLVQGQRRVELRPLHPILKKYIHSVFFRTPALAPRGLRLLIQGLARIHFEQREGGALDEDLLPNMKVRFYARPLSMALLREVYRKLACFNNDDLLVALFGMLAMNMFELHLAEDLVREALRMWAHQKAESLLLPNQRRMIGLFFETLRGSCPSMYSKLDPESIRLLVE